MKALFVCSQNRLRSPTAERVFFNRAGLEVRSAGTDREADNPISRDDIEWADIVFVMEKRHRNKLHAMFKDLYESKRIVCLFIPDEYEFMQPELVKLLQAKVEPYLEHLLNPSETTAT